MDINDKLKALKRVYKVYTEFADGLDVACKRYCSICCTSDVTMTTLEGYLLLENLDPKKLGDLSRRIEGAACENRFQPGITINGMAERCMNGDELPVEKKNENSGTCPFLTDNECPIYATRPMGCRCMVSKKNCLKTGYAEMDDFILAVNNMFLQVIEHIDSDGCTGNFIDIILSLSDKNKRSDFQKKGHFNCDQSLISNRPLTVLMIPPEYRERIDPILKALQKITI